MAHNLLENDSMLSVGKTPWHGLGVTLKEAPKTGEEALRIASLDWNVTKVPMFLEDGRRVEIKGTPRKNGNGHHGVIVRDDTNEMLGVVGSSFVPYQNSKMASLFNPLIEEGKIDIETCGSLFNGRRVWMLGKVRGGSVSVTSNDTVDRYVLLAHGHDGSLAVRFGVVGIRVVCHNTLSMAVSDESSKLVRCLHTSSLDENLNVLRDALNISDEVFELTAEQYRALAYRSVNKTDLKEYARILVKADKDESKWTAPERRKIGQIVDAAIKGIGNDGANWWHAYNGYTEYLTWNAGRKPDNRLDSLWFGPGVESNSKALSLALEMSLAV